MLADTVCPMIENHFQSRIPKRGHSALLKRVSAVTNLTRPNTLLSSAGYQRLLQQNAREKKRSYQGLPFKKEEKEEQMKKEEKGWELKGGKAKSKRKKETDKKR